MVGAMSKKKAASKRSRTERREADRSAVKLAEARMKLAALEPGGSSERPIEVVRDPQLPTERLLHGPRERPDTTRAGSHEGLKHAEEGGQRLLVVGENLDAARWNSGLVQAVLDRPHGQRRVVLAASEAFLLRRRGDLAVAQEGRRGVVIQAAHAEHVGFGHVSEQGVDGVGDGCLRRAPEGDDHR